MPNSFIDFFKHLANAGSFNEGQQGQVSGNDLPDDVKKHVDQLAAQRDIMAALDHPAEKQEVADLQQAINLLYNPRTRGAAMASWKQLGGDVGNEWSATGGRLGTAAGIVNSMTTDPDHHYYGGRRGGPNVPAGASVRSGQ